jgi:hypothetical protein
MVAFHGLEASEAWDEESLLDLQGNVFWTLVSGVALWTA